MRITLSFLFLLFFLCSNAQVEIFLENPSFEDVPKLSQTPTGWYNCGFPEEPNIHPVPESTLKVDKTAYNGRTYLGLTVRDNETWDAVGQKLSQPLKADKVYSFSIHLVRSAIYLDVSRKTKELKKINYATPIKLRIWGGNSYCQKAELLAESPLVINTRWLNFNFQFEPHIDINYITFEAFYTTPSPYPYNGNILLDNASSLTEIIDGFVSKKSSYETDTISKIVKVDTVSSKPTIIPSPKSKTAVPPVINKVSEEKPYTKKDNSSNKKDRILPKSTGINKFSTPIIDFYKEHTLLIEFQGESSDLDELSLQALTLMAERLLTIDKDLKIIIQPKAPNASLKKERLNAIKSVLTKAKLKENQYTFGFETNTPVLMNESNSSVRIKLCLR